MQFLPAVMDLAKTKTIQIVCWHISGQINTTLMSTTFMFEEDFLRTNRTANLYNDDIYSIITQSH